MHSFIWLAVSVWALKICRNSSLISPSQPPAIPAYGHLFPSLPPHTCSWICQNPPQKLHLLFSAVVPSRAGTCQLFGCGMWLNEYIVSVGYQHDMIVNVWSWKVSSPGGWVDKSVAKLNRVDKSVSNLFQFHLASSLYFIIIIFLTFIDADKFEHDRAPIP